MTSGQSSIGFSNQRVVTEINQRRMVLVVNHFTTNRELGSSGGDIEVQYFAIANLNQHEVGNC